MLLTSLLFNFMNLSNLKIYFSCADHTVATKLVAGSSHEAVDGAGTVEVEDCLVITHPVRSLAQEIKDNVKDNLKILEELQLGM